MYVRSSLELRTKELTMIIETLAESLYDELRVYDPHQTKNHTLRLTLEPKSSMVEVAPGHYRRDRGDAGRNNTSRIWNLLGGGSVDVYTFLHDWDIRTIPTAVNDIRHMYKFSDVTLFVKGLDHRTLSLYASLIEMGVPTRLRLRVNDTSVQIKDIIFDDYAVYNKDKGDQVSLISNNGVSVTIRAPRYFLVPKDTDPEVIKQLSTEYNILVGDIPPE